MVPGLSLLQSTTPVTHWHLQLSQPQANHRPAVQHTTSAPGCILTFSSCLAWQHLINYETNIVKFQWCCLFNKGGNTGTIHLLLGFGFPSMMEIKILFIKSIGLENILNMYDLLQFCRNINTVAVEEQIQPLFQRLLSARPPVAPSCCCSIRSDLWQPLIRGENACSFRRTAPRINPLFCCGGPPS